MNPRQRGKAEEFQGGRESPPSQNYTQGRAAFHRRPKIMSTSL
jgi:hypothetical protein